MNVGFTQVPDLQTPPLNLKFPDLDGTQNTHSFKRKEADGFLTTENEEISKRRLIFLMKSFITAATKG